MTNLCALVGLLFEDFVDGGTADRDNISFKCHTCYLIVSRPTTPRQHQGQRCLEPYTIHTHPRCRVMLKSVTVRNTTRVQLNIKKIIHK